MQPNLIYASKQMICISFFFFFLQGPTHIKRAPTDKLREVFLKYASYEKNGERFMTSEDFIRGYLGLFPEPNYNKVSRKKKTEIVKKKNINSSHIFLSYFTFQYDRTL